MKRTKEEFMVKFRGVKANVLTRALNRITLGTNWSGCSKGHIAEIWAKAESSFDTRLSKVSLLQLQREIKEVEAGK
jgi:hypothetical protein